MEVLAKVVWFLVCSSLNNCPLKIVMSRKLIAWLELSIVNFKFGCSKLTFSKKLVGSCLVGHIMKMSSMYLAISNGLKFVVFRKLFNNTDIYIYICDCWGERCSHCSLNESKLTEFKEVV